MPNDLYHFHESDLNRTLLGFYKNLPNEKLQKMFKASMGGELDKDSSDVLQGYRGPQDNGDSGDSDYLGPSYGLQEVKYWWGVSKHLNWIPVLGPLVYGIGRAVGDTKWHSLYFDNKTGECLSHDKEIAAHKLNKIGKELLASGKFHEAKEYFFNAYRHSNEKETYEKYNKNRDKAQAAIDKSQSDTYSNNQADTLYKEGCELFNQGEYEEAYDKFYQAYRKCTDGYSEEAKFKKNRDAAKNKQADLLDKEGFELYKQGKYQEAFNKFDQAYKKCTEGYSEEERFKRNRDKAQAEKHALNLNIQGDILFQLGEYSEALVKYQEAYNKSQLSAQRNKFEANINKAKYESTSKDFSSFLSSIERKLSHSLIGRLICSICRLIIRLSRLIYRFFRHCFLEN